MPQFVGQPLGQYLWAGNRRRAQWNLRDFGATGNGITDDSAAVNAALTRCATDGRPLYVPAGTYYAPSLATIPDNVEGFGDSGTTIATGLPGTPSSITVADAVGASWLKGPVVFGSDSQFSRLKIGGSVSGKCGVTGSATASHTTFTDCYFTGGCAGSDWTSVFMLDPTAAETRSGSNSYITLEGCRIAGGLTGADGFHVYDRTGVVGNGGVTDITLDNCYFEAGQRMSFSVDGRGSGIYQRINLTNCTFEPAGGEAITYDGPALDAHCTISNVLIEGAGANPDSWSHGFEINGPQGFTVSDVTVWTVPGAAWNLNGPASDGSVACYWTFTNCVADMTLGSGTHTAGLAVLHATGMKGVTWNGCTFTPGNGVNGSLASCIDNDFTGATFNGAAFANKQVVEDTGCSGNTGLPLALSNLSVTCGSTNGGNVVVITGAGLDSPSAVNFGATPAAAYTPNSPMQITATAPAHTAGAVDVTVTTSGGTSATSAADLFTFGYLFGVNQIGSGSIANWSNYKAVMQVVLPEAGHVTKLSAYLANSGSTCHVKAVIYANSAGAPAALSATGSEVAIANGAAAWHDLAFASPVSLAAGTYWIGFIADSSSSGLSPYGQYETACSTVYGADTYSDGAANPFGSATPFSLGWSSVYATYTVP